MPKDYANRKTKTGSTGSRKNLFSTHPQARQIGKRTSPSLTTFSLTSFSAGLILGMAATILVLYVLDITEPTKPPIAATDRADRPSPRFDFYKLLPGARVVPDTEPYAIYQADHDMAKEYLLQAGSFRYQRDADELRASLLLAGVNASTTEVRIDDEVWYRVVVGPFGTKREAQREITRLRERNISAFLLERSHPAG